MINYTKYTSATLTIKLRDFIQFHKLSYMKIAVYCATGLLHRDKLDGTFFVKKKEYFETL